MNLRTFQQITLWFLLLSMSVLASGKNWTKPQLLANNKYVSTSSASVNANGTAAAIWAAGPVNNTLQVQASVRPSGGAWSKPFPLTKGLQFVADQNIAVAPNNDILAVWLVGFAPAVTQVAFYRNGLWGAPVTISTPGLSAAMPTIAFDAQSNATVVWEQNTSTSCATLAALGTASTGLGTPQTISTGCYGWTRVAVNSWGDAVVVSGASSGSGPVVAISRDRTGTWGSPVTVSANQYLQRLPHVGLGDDGTAVVAFGQRSAPAYSKRAPNGLWSAVGLIYTGTNYGGTCNVAVDGSGNAVAAYDTYVYGGPGGISYPAYATYMPVNGTWGTPVKIMNGYTLQLEVAATHAGTFIVGWADSNSFSVGASTLLPGATSWSSERIGPGWPFSLNADTGSAIATFGGVITTQIGVSTETIP